MNCELLNLVERLDNPVLHEAEVIPWGSPIISFGSIDNSKIATLGLNPSNKEFVDGNGNELEGENRRFHTLKSLGLNSWKYVSENDLLSIKDLCDNYFYRNPYDSWFKKLDYLISGTSLSYYFPSSQACHLDLIPYATSCKWSALTNYQKELLIEQSGDTLGLLLQNSSIELLILNGKTVIDTLENISDINFEVKEMPNWTLPRNSNGGVKGYSYKGYLSSIGGISLKKEIMVLGYNHNIQSSYGVTSEVQKSIRDWITEITEF